MRYLIVCLLAISSSSVFSSDGAKEKFIQKYKAYNGFVEQQDWDSATREAKDLVSLSKDLFGADHKNTAAMSYNYGRSLLKAKRYKPAKKELLVAVKSYQKIYGKNSQELIDPYMDLGKATNFSKKKDCSKDSYLEKAIKVARYTKMPELLIAELNHEAGVSCMSSNPTEASVYLEQSHNVFSSKFGSDDLRVVLSRIHLGKAFEELDKDEKAKEYLLLAWTALNGAPESVTRYKLSTNQLLVKVYEKMGDRAAANKYCQEIGLLEPWTASEEAKPIYTVAPKYPTRAVNFHREGFVKVKFYVDENGYAKSPEVVDWKGDLGFSGSALEALDKWRFVPQLKDGEPIDSELTTYTFNFDLPGDRVVSKSAGVGRQSSYGANQWEEEAYQPHIFGRGGIGK